MQEEIKTLKKLLNKKTRKINEKNLIIGWLNDPEKQQEIIKLKEQINKMYKQLEEKDLIIGWLLDRK